MEISRLNWRLREMLFSLARPLFHVGVRATSNLTGKLRPLGEHDRAVVVVRRPEAVPPPSLWVGYAETAEDYLADGRADMEAVLGLLARHGISQPQVALDLGCAAGRMTRHFPRGEGSEIWGADISAPHVVWCQQNLPDLNFVTISTAPHLPFTDDYFDFVVCASVFSHMTDLADAWLLEIRRVLKPGGHVYLTIHDKLSARQMQTTYADCVSSSTLGQLKALERSHRIWEPECEMFYFDADPSAQVFYDREYVTRKWSRWLPLVAYEGQFHNYQSAMLLRKSG
jgi:ubiquinone/menaquinone biosynthesis C-methylase UbiE